MAVAVLLATLAGSAMAGETFWQWLVRKLTQEAGGWWH